LESSDLWPAPLWLEYTDRQPLWKPWHVIPLPSIAEGVCVAPVSLQGMSESEFRESFDSPRPSAPSAEVPVGGKGVDNGLHLCRIGKMFEKGIQVELVYIDENRISRSGEVVPCVKP
jgi:hypothetical protein